MYWVLWLISGIMFEVLFCAFILPIVVKKAVKTLSLGTLKGKVLWPTLMSVAFVFAGVMLIWIIATFAYRASKGFYIGSGEVKAVISWPFYFFLSLPIVVAVTLGKNIQKIRERTAEIAPVKKAQKPKFTLNKEKILWIAIKVLCALAVIAATVPLSMNLQYIMLKLFSLTAAKRTLTLFIVAELVLSGVYVYFLREHFKWYKYLKYILPAALFVFTMSFFILLVGAPRPTVDSVFMWGGTIVFVIIPIAIATSYMMIRAKLSHYNIAKRQCNKKNFKKIK